MVAESQKPITPTELEDQSTEPRHKPDGPLAAALIAGGVAIFTLGAVTTLAQANTNFSNALAWNQGVGALSGKTIIEVAVFIVVWAVLTPLLWKRDGLLRLAAVAFIVLAVLGYLGTFPTFFDLF
jgi:hypothetical protein